MLERQVGISCCQRLLASGRPAERRRVSEPTAATLGRSAARSEEHTSELQSQSNLVCRLLLEKKKATTTPIPIIHGQPPLTLSGFFWLAPALSALGPHAHSPTFRPYMRLCATSCRSRGPAWSA